jgi:hypothetical protein|tara:strand:- start:123 stop:377 length:255 start_codon:yes stop_codon:yes gene_type:complete
MLTRKDEIGFSPKPMFDFITGQDDIYLCSPIEVEDTYTCLFVESYTDHFNTMSQTNQILSTLIVIVGYHLLFYYLSQFLFKQKK